MHITKWSDSLHREIDHRMICSVDINALWKPPFENEALVNEPGKNGLRVYRGGCRSIFTDNKTYLDFVNGDYSLMYKPSEITKYFKYLSIANKEIESRQNKKLKETRSVLTKDKNYLKTFVDRVNKDFGTNVSTDSFIRAELDYPPVKKEEIFNYKDEKNK